MNYYNEWDKSAAAWLRELIRQGLIPPGDVDERSITEIKPYELTRYTQCHFFAGIGGWPLALQLAGWPVARPVGTGSCPCQPFSAAGKQLGNADDRHLWPAFFRLIIACRALGQRWTDSIFGEQVESAIGHGWLDSVSADMEREGYAFGAAILGAHSVCAPHRRQRLYWVAYANQGQCGWLADGEGREPNGEAAGRVEGNSVAESGGADRSLGNPHSPRLDGPQPAPEGDPRDEARMRVPGDGQPDRPLEHPARDGRQQRGAESGERGAVGGRGDGGALAHADSHGRGQAGRDDASDLEADSGWARDRTGHAGAHDLGATWRDDCFFMSCTDGRKRLVKSGIFPLAHGFPSRVGLLRGSGNAIVPQAAAAFIQASEEARASSRGVIAAPAPEDWT